MRVNDFLSSKLCKNKRFVSACGLKIPVIDGIRNRKINDIDWKFIYVLVRKYPSPAKGIFRPDH